MLRDVRLLGWALAFSAINGAVVLFIAGLSGANFTWYQGIFGGAVFGACLTLLFETPLRALVRWVIDIPLAGWALALPLIIMRFMLSWPGVMIANQFAALGTGTRASRSASRAPATTSAPPAAARDSGQTKTAPPRAGATCEQCDYRGNGKCSTCHGSGKEPDVMTALAASLAGTTQACRMCGGDGRCRSCAGKGHVR